MQLFAISRFVIIAAASFPVNEKIKILHCSLQLLLRLRYDNSKNQSK